MALKYPEFTPETNNIVVLLLLLLATHMQLISVFTYLKVFHKILVSYLYSIAVILIVKLSDRADRCVSSYSAPRAPFPPLIKAACNRGEVIVVHRESINRVCIQNAPCLAG